VSSVIDSLKRLERAGAEDSKTTAKLVAAARDLAAYLEREVLPKDVQNEWPAPYLTSQGDGWVWNGRVLYRGHPDFVEAPASQDWQRGEALLFAQFIAEGWLDRVGDWLEERTQQASAATETLHRASAALGAGAEQSSCLASS
jgi:hypothetical protein